MTDLVARLRDVLSDEEWDTLKASDFHLTHPAARLCPLCGAWVWSADKHRGWHLQTDPRLAASSSSPESREKKPNG